MSIIIFQSNSTIPTKIPQQPKITNPIKIPTTPSTTLPHIYERQITHTADINFINDRYTTPVTVALGSSELDKTVNLPVKHQKLFSALKKNPRPITIHHNQRYYHQSSKRATNGHHIHRNVRSHY